MDAFTEIGLSAFLFILMWVLLGNFVLKPFFSLLEEREERTEGDIKRAAEVRAERESVLARIEERLKDARLDGIATREAFIAKAKEQGGEVISAATEKAQAELLLARQQLKTLTAEAHRELEAEAGTLADLVISRVLSEGKSPVVH